MYDSRSYESVKKSHITVANLRCENLLESPILYKEMQMLTQTDAVNKPEYIMSMGVLNVRIGDKTILECMGIYGESTCHKNDICLEDVYNFNNIRISKFLF
jgi:hypothetical protein